MASKPGQHMPAEHSGDDEQSLPALLSRYHSAISPSMVCAASSESKNKLREELEEFIVVPVRSQIAEMEVRMDAHLVQMTEERCGAGLFHSQHSRHGVMFSGTASNASRSSVAKTWSMISLQAAAGESQSQGTPCSQKTKIDEATPSQFNFTHSTWDTLMLVGIDAVGLWESFYLVLLMKPSSRRRRWNRQRFALVTEYEQFFVFKSFLKADDSYPGPDMEPIADTALFTSGADAEAYLSLA